MGFNYDRNKQKHGDDAMWTSYSDLFLGLSIVFLLLYVSASLRQGTAGIQQHIENKQLTKEIEVLKQEIKSANMLAKDYLAKQASEEEQENYTELMSKLDLLQEEAKDEKAKLEMQARSNAEKADALNKYQRMIRGIINSNVLAKAKIKKRDTLIDTKEEIITEKSKEIDGLEETVAQRQAEIQQGEKKIEGLQSELDKQVAQLRKSYNNQKITKTKFEQQQRALKKQAEDRIAALREYNAKVQQDLERAAQELQATSQELQATSQELNQAQGTVAKLGQEKNRLEGELESAAGRHQAEVARLRGEADAKGQRERAAFEAALAKEKLSGAERAAREAAFKADAERKAKALGDQIAQAEGKFRESQKALARAQEDLNARRNLAKQIKQNFAKSGVKAEVDEKSGDVLLSFGDEYFGTGSAELRPKMRQIIEKAMPAYSASLFQDPKIAEKIQSVEIVGFASPTYKGKFVDPTSLDPENREAVNYNLDLSYNRARSIFNYVFDKRKVTFKHQQNLLPLVKVTGRSFLSNDTNRDPAADTSAEDFCRKNDCAKLQRVIIKFTLQD